MAKLFRSGEIEEILLSLFQTLVPFVAVVVLLLVVIIATGQLVGYLVNGG